MNPMHQRYIEAMTAQARTAQARPMPPGVVEYQCRCAIRDMLEAHGAKATVWIVTQMLDDETARMKQ